MPVGRRGGRSSVFPKGKRNLLTIWLYEEDYKILREKAAEDLAPMGSIARKVVVDYLRRLPRQKNS